MGPWLVAAGYRFATVWFGTRVAGRVAECGSANTGCRAGSSLPACPGPPMRARARRIEGRGAEPAVFYFFSSGGGGGSGGAMDGIIGMAGIIGFVVCKPRARRLGP